MTLPIVRTVQGDVAPESLGITYPHEHLIIDSPLVHDRWPHIALTSVDDAVAELALCSAAGVGTVVDAMPAAAGRDAVRLAAISRASGMNIVACTGLHAPRYYEGQGWTVEESPEVLAELFVADIIEGIDRYDYTSPVVRRTEHRAGVVKVAAGEATLTERDRRLFEAAFIAHMRTGVPVLTHCEEGRGGLEQCEFLTDLGLPLDRVALSHTDKVADIAYHRDLLSTGVYLEFDQALRQGDGSVDGTGRLVARLVSEGFGDQLLLSTDGARRALWQVHGGRGLAWLASGFASILDQLGVDQPTREQLLVTNPARFLAFSPAA